MNLKLVFSSPSAVIFSHKEVFLELNSTLQCERISSFFKEKSRFSPRVMKGLRLADTADRKLEKKHVFSPHFDYIL